MKSLVIFLNELSFTTGDLMAAQGLLQPILSTLAAVRAAKKLRDDIVVAGNAPISGLTLGQQDRSLGEILRGDIYRDEWRFLRSLDQSSPWDAYPGCVTPGPLEEVKYQGKTAIGMLWAKQNESSILSFGFLPVWDNCHVSAKLQIMDHAAEITATELQIPNLSKPEHVIIHAALINNYGKILSPSSLIYEGNGFAVRMFFNDHNPPHFHVFRPDTTEVLGRYAIRTLDLMSGEISMALGRRVREWAGDRTDDLMECWDRCRAGQHPLSLDD